MTTMKKTFSVYATGYLALLTITLILICVWPKQELHLMLNAYHTGILDTFFKYYSIMAEWPLYALALLPILWKKIKLTLFFGLCELTGGAFLQILKHLFSSPRPGSAFSASQQAMLHVVDGVDLYSGNSFPSGHASTFFIFFTCCALLLAYHYRKTAEQNRQKRYLIDILFLLLLALAALGAFSRVYLSQHFLSDVCVGSIIGFVTPCLMFQFAGKKILKLKTTDDKDIT